MLTIRKNGTRNAEAGAEASTRLHLILNQQVIHT
jgi:hypothetical protein